MSFPLASIAVYSSVVFGVFSNTQRLLSHFRHGDSARAPVLADVALASIVAGFISVGIGTPVDLVKIRLQMQTQPYIEANIKPKPTVPGFPAYRGPIHCFRTVLQKEGIAGIYRGMGAMLLRDVPGYCLYFIPYTFFCSWINPDGCISPSPSSIWLAGGVAGAISWVTATPMDVVKSRLQADGVHLNKYKGTLDCILQSYRNEGLKEERSLGCPCRETAGSSCSCLPIAEPGHELACFVEGTEHMRQNNLSSNTIIEWLNRIFQAQRDRNLCESLARGKQCQYKTKGNVKEFLKKILQTYQAINKRRA
ncbi:solute carrier family 25 member 48 isoform X2 [Chroicocephalus ridibundus]